MVDWATRRPQMPRPFIASWCTSSTSALGVACDAFPRVDIGCATGVAVDDVNWLGNGSKDRRRRLSREEAAELYARADGVCQKCQTALGVDWHQAHLVAYAHGGATSLDQMEAWCRDCN